MGIKLEKILNLNIRDYIESKKTNLKGYLLYGVHSDTKDIKEFAKLVPNDAEIVINYQVQFFGVSDCKGGIRFIYRQMGTALIPRKK